MARKECKMCDNINRTMTWAVGAVRTMFLEESEVSEKTLERRIRRSFPPDGRYSVRLPCPECRGADFKSAIQKIKSLELKPKKIPPSTILVSELYPPDEKHSAGFCEETCRRCGKNTLHHASMLVPPNLLLRKLSDYISNNNPIYFRCGLCGETWELS